jgi:hypothetical protein
MARKTPRERAQEITATNHFESDSEAVKRRIEKLIARAIWEAELAVSEEAAQLLDDCATDAYGRIKNLVGLLKDTT